MITLWPRFNVAEAALPRKSTSGSSALRFLLLLQCSRGSVASEIGAAWRAIKKHGKLQCSRGSVASEMV